jgi:polyisoprenoid-binding protein YceI
MINRLILLLLSSLLSVEYGAETWALDPTNSSIQFNVSHLLISTVPGTFNDFEVQIHPQIENSFDQTKLEAVIKVESIDTGNKQRDSHLLKSDFFDSTVYPNITFQNALLVFSNETNFQVIGDLTIKEHTKKITFDGTFGGFARMWGKERAGFSATGKINRFDFGINYNDKLASGSWIVGEEIIFHLNLEFVKRN